MIILDGGMGQELVKRAGKATDLWSIKPQDFPGKAALQNEKQQGRKKAFASLIVEAGAYDAPYMSTIWHDGVVVGETTSGDFGYRVGKSIALAMLRPDLAVCREQRLKLKFLGNAARPWCRMINRFGIQKMSACAADKERM